MGVKKTYIPGKVSIIMPVFNRTDCLVEALDDINAQSYENFELICVDDGSTDGATDVLRQWADRDGRIRLFFRSHEGAGAARNFGLEQADGEYVLFLDSDDRFEEKLLELSVQAAQDRETDILFFDAACFESESGKEMASDWFIQRHVLPKKDIFSYRDCPENIFNLSFNVPWNKLYRHEFIDESGLSFQNTSFMNDVYFVHVATVLAEKISFLDTKLVRYRRNDGASLSGASKRQKEPLVALEIMRSIRSELIKRKIYEKVHRSFVLAACLHLLGNLEMVEGEVYFRIFPLTKQCLLGEFRARTAKFDDEHESYFQKRVAALEQMEATEYLFFLVKLYHGMLDDTVTDIWNCSLIIKGQDTYIANLEETIKRKCWLWRGRPLNGKKIVLYGAGDIGRDYYECFTSIKNGPVIVAWVDKNFAVLKGNDGKVESPSVMKNRDFDYVIIAVRNERTAGKIREFCLAYAEEEKIIWQEP